MENNSIETLVLAVKEQLEEQVKTNQSLADCLTAVNLVKSAVDNIHEKLNDQNLTLSEEDKKFIEKTIKQQFYDFRNYIELTLGKVRANNLQLFLQSDAKKWLVILIIGCLFLTYLYYFGLHCLK